MNILLDGYFDKNFGDEMMQLLVVKGMPEHDFYVSCAQREMLAHLENVPNVHIGENASRIDAYVNVIGTGFLFNGKRAAAEKILSILGGDRKKYPKSAVIDCSVETVKGRVSEILTKRELRKYGLISCRDSESFAYISKACPKSEVQLHEDIVFSIADGREKADKCGDCLGIAPARRVYSTENYEYYRTIAKYCDSFVKKHDKKILLFAFDSGFENDISAALSVQKMMKYSEMSEIVAFNSDTEAFIQNQARCSLFIGSRFHSVVTALSLGIPVIAVSDTEKLRRLCEKYNVPILKRSGLTAESLSATVEKTEKEGKLSEISVQTVYDARGHIRELRDYLGK